MDLSSRKVYDDWPGIRVRSSECGVMSSEGQALRDLEDSPGVEFFSNGVVASIKKIDQEPHYWRDRSVSSVVAPDGLPCPLVNFNVGHVAGSEDWTLPSWQRGVQIQAGPPGSSPSLVSDYYDDGTFRATSSKGTMCVFGSILRDSENTSVWTETAYVIRLCLIGDRLVGCVSSSKSPSEEWYGDKKKNGGVLYGEGKRMSSVFFSTETDVVSMSYLPSECKTGEPVATPRGTVPHFGVAWDRASGGIIQLVEGEFYPMGYNPDDSTIKTIIEDGEEEGGGLLSHAFKGDLLDASSTAHIDSWVKPRDLETTLEIIERIKEKHDKLRSIKDSPGLAFRNLIRAGAGFWEALELA